MFGAGIDLPADDLLEHGRKQSVGRRIDPRDFRR
jgi:hypothetical protein